MAGEEAVIMGIQLASILMRVSGIRILPDACPIASKYFIFQRRAALKSQND
jgi:hypothetical protein